MSLKPLSTSTTAWTWCAMDFSQGELVAESFAIRFKKEEDAALFKQKFEECQAALKAPVSQTESITSPVVQSVSSDAAASASKEVEAGQYEEYEGEEGEDEEDGDEEENENEEDQDEEEYEDIEESIMFEKRCTLSYLETGAWKLLGTGNLKIVYDDEMLCAKIVVENGDEELLCDNVIAIETQLKVPYITEKLEGFSY